MEYPPVPEPKLNILIVDDIDVNCDLLNYFLSGVASLDMATSGEEAISKTARKRYDLVLLDICLGPGIDGVEVMTRMTSQPGNDQLKIIAVTGSATEFERDDFLEKGFTEFLPKPVSKSELFSCLRKVFPGRF